MIANAFWAVLHLLFILAACWVIEGYVGVTLARGWSTRRIVITFVLVFIGPGLFVLEYVK